MASALYTDVKRKGERSTFTRCAPARAAGPACWRTRAAALAYPPPTLTAAGRKAAYTLHHWARWPSGPGPKEAVEHIMPQ